MNISEINRETGIGRKTLRDWAKEGLLYGLVVREPKKQYSQDVIDLAQELLNQELMTKEIAEQLGLKESTIKYLLRKKKIVRPHLHPKEQYIPYLHPKRPPKRKRSKLTSADFECLGEKYNQGLFDTQIAKECSVPLNRVKTWRKENNLPPYRKPSPRLTRERVIFTPENEEIYRQRARDLYRKHESIRAVSRELFNSIAPNFFYRIKEWVKDLIIEPAKPTLENITKVKELRQAGWSKAKLMKHFKIGPTKLHEWLGSKRNPLRRRS